MKKKDKNKNTIFQMTWRLIIVCAAAAVLLGLTYAVTKDPITEQNMLKADAANRETLSEAENFKAIDISPFKSSSGWQSAYDEITGAVKGLSKGNTVGYIINMTAKGYNKGIKLTIGIGTDGIIKGVAITDMNETPGLGAKAKEPDFTGQYKGKTVENKLTVVKGKKTDEVSSATSSGNNNGNEIEAITGATITSKGITSAVNTAMDFFKNYLEGKES